MIECNETMRQTYSPQWTSLEARQKFNGKCWSLPSYSNNNSYISYTPYRNSVMRMTMSTGSTMTSRIHRKVIRIPTKRHPGKGKALPGKLHQMSRMSPGKLVPGKRMINQQQQQPTNVMIRSNPTHCDNSNDSGLGFDQHIDVATYTSNTRPISSHANHTSTRADVTMPLITNHTVPTKLTSSENSAHQIIHIGKAICNNTIEIDDDGDDSNESIDDNGVTTTICTVTSPISPLKIKRVKVEGREADIDIDCDCSNDTHLFQHHRTKIQRQNPQERVKQQRIERVMIPNTNRLVCPPRNPPRLSNRRQLSNTISVGQPTEGVSRNGRIQLQILAQPEQQHRARYQTEGSRGAVKDRSGNGFPIIKLCGYNKPAILEIFIGTDVGRISPHMFYQACKVSGKNSTPCNEKKLEGTMIIEIELKPETDMIATCDCVGILKERNVDVEHRFPDQSGPRSKKKSTRCRMVFRTQISNDDGTVETLQICSQQIICTQPPGVPEICKKSLVSCPAMGGLELFIIGKNFLKDSRVIFQSRSMSPNRSDRYDVLWEESVQPDKEFLQQTHIVCTVPPYLSSDITDPVTVQLFVTSSNKKSETHNFLYTPKGSHGILAAATTLGLLSNNSQDARYNPVNDATNNPSMLIWNRSQHVATDQINEIDAGMMPPPSALPLNVRRPSASGLLGIVNVDQMSPPLLKSEILDENSQGSIGDNLCNHNSMDRFSDNDNSMDATTSPIKDYQQQQAFLATTGGRIRKQSIDLMDSNSMMGCSSNSVDMIGAFQAQTLDSNSNSGMNMMQMNAVAAAIEMNVVDLRVKQEQQMAAVAAAQLNHADTLLNAAVQHQQQQQQQAEENKQINKFLSNLKQTAVAMYANDAANTAANVGQVMMNDITNQLSITTNSVMDTTQSSFGVPPVTTLLNDGTANQMIVQQNIPLLDVTNTNHSPLSQDVILNSQPATTLNSPNSLTVLTSPDFRPSPTTDIIMNTNVSPTMMCHSQTDTTGLLSPSTVTIGGPVMGQQQVNSQQQQAQQEAQMLNNLIQPMITNQSETIHITPKTAPVAVKNMILNAAAEILSSNPTQNMSAAAESSINALITTAILSDTTDNSQMLMTQAPSSVSMNDATMLIQPNQQQQQQQCLNMNDQVTAAALSLHNGNTVQQSIYDNGIMRQPNGQSVQNIVPITTTQNPAGIMESAMNNLSNIVSSQMINQHEIEQEQIRRAVRHSYLDPYQKSMQMGGGQELQQTMTVGNGTNSNMVSQESLLQAVALVRNEQMERKNSVNGQSTVTTVPTIITTIAGTLVNNLNVATAMAPIAQHQLQQAASVTTTTTAATVANIQDLTTMSDNDLISYINPSCFDQGTMFNQMMEMY